MITDNRILINRIKLYLITILSNDIIKRNKLRYITELLLNEENIKIFKCFSKNFDKNFSCLKNCSKNCEQSSCIPPDLEWFLINRTKLYKNKKFDTRVTIDPDLEWLYYNIKALYRWNNNTGELKEDIEFKEPPYLKYIVNNLINSYNHYTETALEKRVIII